MSAALNRPDKRTFAPGPALSATITLAKAFSPSGCGRILPLFSRVMWEGLLTGPGADGSGIVLWGQYSPDLLTARDPVQSVTLLKL